MNGAFQVESDFVFGSWLLSNGSVRFQERVNPRSGGPPSFLPLPVDRLLRAPFMQQKIK